MFPGRKYMLFDIAVRRQVRPTCSRPMSPTYSQPFEPKKNFVQCWKYVNEISEFQRNNLATKFQPQSWNQISTVMQQNCFYGYVEFRFKKCCIKIYWLPKTNVIQTNILLKITLKTTFIKPHNLKITLIKPSLRSHFVWLTLF